MSKLSFKNLAPKPASPAKIKAMYEAEDIKYKMQESVLAANESAILRGTFKVLVVSDSTRSQNIMIYSIKQNLLFPYVKVADSVASAIEMLESEKFDVVVSSYRMSDKDGTDVHKHIENMPNKPYFIMALDFTEYEAANLRSAGIITLPAQYSPEHLEMTFKAVYTRFIDDKLARINLGKGLDLV